MTAAILTAIPQVEKNAVLGVHQVDGLLGRQALPALAGLVPPQEHDDSQKGANQHPLL